MKEDKIEVGEYIRTDKGICKVLSISQAEYGYHGEVDNNNIRTFTVGKGGSRELREAKHSKNIIDLIEVGDYVNGHRVEYIDTCKGAMRQFYWFDEYKTNQCGHYYEEIKSVVTKEQFKSIEYRLED